MKLGVACINHMVQSPTSSVAVREKQRHIGIGKLVAGLTNNNYAAFFVFVILLKTLQLFVK